MTFTVAIYIVAVLLLLCSWARDKQKTATALRSAARSFNGILPLLLSITLVIGMTLAVLSPKTISMLIGRGSGIAGVMIAAFIGSVTLIPGFVTFPLAASLLKAGAGMAQIIVFVSTSMMVGVATAPVEVKYLGRKATITRNGLALVLSFAIAAIMWRVLR